MALVIHNAKIYVHRGTFAEAMVIDGTRIQGLGTSQDLLAANPKAERFDAGGRTVVPGFNDSHLHLQMVGANLRSVNLHGAKGIDDIIARVRAFMDKHCPAPGTLIHGFGWNQDLFEGSNRLPDRRDLDRITTQYPVVLDRTCGHIAAANSKAIEIAGLTKDSQPPAGGAFDRDEAGELTGVFRENGCQPLKALKPPITKESLLQDLRAAMEYAASWGITSVQTMDLRPDSWEIMWETYCLAQMTPTIRAYHQFNFQEPQGFQTFLDKGFQTGRGDSYNKIGPLKMFVDGSLGARTALMRQPYHDDPSTCGIEVLNQQELDTMVRMATEHTCQVAIHAIGDRAIEQVLNSYDSVCKGSNPRRHGVVHCQITDRALLERFKKSDILAYAQPIFIDYDSTIVADRVGPELAASSYNFGTLTRMGVHTSLGTDSPVEDLNTMNNLYCAVTRKTLKNPDGPGYLPEEALDIYQAIDGYTIESAYTSFEEDCKGRLKPDYYADLAVLDRDIFTIAPEEITQVRVDATMVGGRWVYQR